MNNSNVLRLQHVVLGGGGGDGGGGGESMSLSNDYTRNMLSEVQCRSSPITTLHEQFKIYYSTRP